MFAQYTQFLSKVAPQLNALQDQLKTSANTIQQTLSNIQSQIAKLNKELNDYRQKLIDEHPESMVATFFQAVKIPEIKTWPRKADGSIDSACSMALYERTFLG